MASAVRMAMVGGGEGAFIGAIHRAAARLDGEIELVAGAFSSDPERARRSGAALGLPAGRVYATWRELLAGEAARAAVERAQFIAIVTPNDLHLPVAEGALQLGFHVLSDKPATRTLAEARQLAEAVTRSGCCYALTHTYLGYPLIVEARARVLNGELGPIRRVVVSYAQGWLATRLEGTGHKQADWRTNPARSGPGGSVADIGVHAFNLVEYVTGLAVTEVCADAAATVPGRALDDDMATFLRFANGARGVLTASQVATGEENNLSIQVHGTTGGLSWSHRQPNSLVLLSADGTRSTVRAGADVIALHREARALCRTPAGHPEGFIEAFANLYRAFAADVRAAESGARTMQHSPAGIGAALRGMAFIESVLASSAAHQQWVGL